MIFTHCIQLSSLVTKGKRVFKFATMNILGRATEDSGAYHIDIIYISLFGDCALYFDD